MVCLVHDKEVGDLEDAGLVHLDGVAHPGHHDDRGAVDEGADRDIVLASAHRLDDQLVVARAADQLDDLGQRAVVLADDRERPVEDPLVDRVEVDAQAVAEERAARDRAHRVERDDGDLLAAAHGLARHRGDERALAGSRRARDADDLLRATTRCIDRLRCMRERDVAREQRGGVRRHARCERRIRLHAVADAADDLVHARPRVVDARDARIEELLHIVLRNDAADIHGHVGPANLRALFKQARHEHEVRVRHHRAGDAVCVLVAGADREAARRLPEP